MLAKLIDVYSNSKVGTVATFERAPGVGVGDKVTTGDLTWEIKDVGGANPREPDWVSVLVALEAKPHLVPLIGQQVEIVVANA